MYVDKIHPINCAYADKGGFQLNTYYFKALLVNLKPPISWEYIM